MRVTVDSALDLASNGVHAGKLANGLAKAASLSESDLPTRELPAGAADDWKLHEPICVVDRRDASTPDCWVPRHPELIRLTGRHPFNVEPPPNALMERGFITPTSLHYVRNHGPVPKLSWDTHTLTVGGMVDRQLVLSMDDLARLPTITIACTLSCAGNRRKEQNMVKKSKGFSWGPAATGCSYWTGVRMSTLLRMARAHGHEKGARYVSFRGPIGELPQGGDGSYGTSISLYKAMEDINDVIIAYKQNGRLLTPDHGFPCRLIIPGHIGGRMEITVTAEESQNFYHFHDNRVLPSHVDADLATKEGWWFKPDFIINELNINSAITSPAHDEVVPLSASTSYTIVGYAYTGGTKVIRCEISLDDGKSWRLADISRFEQPNWADKHWCWVHYSLEVPIVDLLQTKEVICRAWDSSMNTQPMNFTWNLMGMMNNYAYRVKVHASACEKGGFALRFEHPVLAGALVGGWMNRAEDQPALPPPETVKAATPASGKLRTITMAEVEKHATKESVWFVRGGKVYDGTPFLKEHPGGADSIMLAAGQDASDEFDAIHSTKAKAMLEDYYVGELAADTADGAVMPAAEVLAVPTTVPAAALATPASLRADSVPMAELIALDPRRRQKFHLVSKEMLSCNVRRLRFALQSPKHKFGLPVGKHVFIYAKVKGEMVVRAYSPVSSDDDLGFFELVIRVYWKDQHQKFPDGGKMSQHLETLAVGDTIEAKGPLGHFTYLGGGQYEHSGESSSCRRISFIAGGTGITPVWQVIRAVLKDPEDRTEMRLLYANSSPADVLLKEELEAFAREHDNFRVWFTVDAAQLNGTKWPYSTGRISDELIAEHLFPAGSNTIAGICGPPGLVNFAALPGLKKLGYSEEQCIVF